MVPVVKFLNENVFPNISDKMIHLPQRQFGLPGFTRIRGIKQEDAHSLERLDELCFAATDPNDSGTVNDLLWDADDFRDEIRRYGSVGKVLSVALFRGRDESYGYVLGATIGNASAELRGTAVHPDYRKRGIFKHLLTLWEAEMDRYGVREVHLHTRTKDNPFYVGAADAFERTGFRVAQTISDHYDPGDAAYLMTKQLRR